MINRYPLTLVPGLVGILAGIIVTGVELGDTKEACKYVELAEYRLWQIIIIIQFSVYLMAFGYLLLQFLYYFCSLPLFL